MFSVDFFKRAACTIRMLPKMLSDLEINNAIEIPYASGAPPFFIQPFIFEKGGTKNLAWIKSVITAGVAIIIPAFFIRNETGAVVFQVGIIPWQFAATTITTTTGQTPSPPLVSLFGNNNISGFIPADFRIFDGWSISFASFASNPGDNCTAVIGLTD